MPEPADHHNPPTLSPSRDDDHRPATPLSVSEAARALGARPRDITNLFYRRALRDDLCPIVGGRRLIPANYLPAIAAVLRHNGMGVADPKGENHAAP